MNIIDCKICKATPIIVFLSGHIYYMIFDDGAYLFYAHFVYLASRDAQIYFIACLLVSLFPLLWSRVGSITVRSIYTVLCFFIIQGIVYRLFSVLLMFQDSSISIWWNHLPEMLIALLFMQYLLLYARLSMKQIAFGNVLVLMVVLATIQREMALSLVLT